MSLPKEPRQKMINMMYLVLTALLALNVSVEVLNAFKTVNYSIERSNKVVDEKNNLTYSAFTREISDPTTAAQAKTWAPAAMQVKAMAAVFTTYLDSLKERLINESSPSMKDGRREFADGNLDAATRIFDVQGQGKILYDSLGKFRQDLLNILNPENFPGISDKVKADLVAQRAEFARRLPVNNRIPQSQEGNELVGNDSAHNWTIRYFHMTPTIAALTILSKFQSDIKNSESQVVDYLHKQVGEVKIVFNKFEPLVEANASYVMPGDDVEVTAGVGAFSDAAKPKISINGQNYEPGPDGTALFKTKAAGAGEHAVNVHIVYTKPDGSEGSTDKTIKYTVGVPSGASIFLEKMNVVYVKEDNPVRISGGSVGAEKVHVSFDKGEITHTSGDEYIVVPTTPGEGTITVTANGKPFTFPMRVKYLPNPTGFVGSKTGGAMSSAEFKAMGGLLARLENSEFQSPFVVVGYKLAALGGGISQYQEANNEGPRWTGQAAAIVAKSTPGTNIFFDNIRVKGKDGRIRELPPMVFSLK
jgi:gliding motility-associated protein GldM